MIYLINLHQIVSVNTASVASSFKGGRHGHLTLTMTSKEYTAHIGYTFVLLKKPVGTAQEKAPRTGIFQKTKQYSGNTPRWTEK